MKKSKLKRRFKETQALLERARHQAYRRRIERDVVMRALVVLVRNAAVVEDICKCEPGQLAS